MSNPFSRYDATDVLEQLVLKTTVPDTKAIAAGFLGLLLRQDEDRHRTIVANGWVLLISEIEKVDGSDEVKLKITAENVIAFQERTDVDGMPEYVPLVWGYGAVTDFAQQSGCKTQLVRGAMHRGTSGVSRDFTAIADCNHPTADECAWILERFENLRDPTKL